MTSGTADRIGRGQSASCGDIDVRTAAVGGAADESTRLAKEGGGNLLVLGSRDLNPLERLVLGSASTKLLHQAPCDMLVVK